MHEVLVDTSVWVDHFRRSNESLANLLSLDMAMLPHARQASLTEVRELIERNTCSDMGVVWWI